MGGAENLQSTIPYSGTYSIYYDCCNFIGVHIRIKVLVMLVDLIELWRMLQKREIGLTIKQ